MCEHNKATFIALETQAMPREPQLISAAGQRTAPFTLSQLQISINV